MTNTVSLLTKLTSIKSHLGNNGNEIEIGDYLFKLINQSNLFDVVIKDFIKGKRFNVVASKGDPKIVFLCHIDTVSPSKEQKHGIEKDKFYGLGAKDMKGGIVALLIALKEIKQCDNIGIIFYCGEETDQSGIKQVIINWKWKNVQLVVSPESRFNIGFGNKGLVIIKVTVHGKEGHTARPSSGINAIDHFIKMYQFLSKNLKHKKSKVLDENIVTLLNIQGGNINQPGGKIPDLCSGEIEFRTILNTGYQDISQLIKTYSQNNNITIEEGNLCDYPAIVIPASKIEVLVKAIVTSGNQVEYGDPSKSGYNDARLLTTTYKIPVVNFGPYGEGNHGSEEWVSIDSVNKTAKVYMELIKLSNAIRD